MQYTRRKLQRSVTEIRRSWSGRARVSSRGISEKYEAPPDRSGGLRGASGLRAGTLESAADGRLHRVRVGESAVAAHRVDELVADPDVEGPVDEWDELDGGQLLAELDHERPSEVRGRILVAALGAVGDADPDGGHAAAGDRSTIWRSARITSRLAQATSSSRRLVISAVSRDRTSSGRSSGEEPYAPNSGCSAWSL